MTPSIGRANHHVLLIDDDPRHAGTFNDAVLAAGDGAPQLEWVSTLAAGLDRLAQHRVWAVFLKLALPVADGTDALDQLLAATSAPVVVLGGKDDDDVCHDAMARGARDYLLEGHLDRYAFLRALRNLDEREVARHELFIEQERARVTLNSIGDAVMSVDLSGRVTYLNQVAEQMTGWPKEEAIGRPATDVFQIVDSVTHQPAPNPLDLAIQLDKVVGLSANCILVRRDGHHTSIEDSTAPIHDRDGQMTGAVIVFHDVSMARARVLEMSHLAHHDALTDLPNRMLLKERLGQAILLARRHSSHLAVLFLDIDGFKRINDSLGHAVGDSLLQSVAARLGRCVRQSDTVSRQGGDEFVILLTEIRQASDATTTAAKIIGQIKRAYHIGEHRVRVTVSIGISTYPDDGIDAETLITNADTAMYFAKEHGRDNYRCYDRTMNLRAVERQSMEGQLRYAVEDSELVLHYQPKVNLTTGAITSVEALVRWQHPQRGLLLPDQFLSIAEDTGMIVPLGQWVLQEACRQTRVWIDAGLPAVPVAVNVSSLEFRGDQFLANVQLALESSELDPRYLELELTESVLMRHAESATDALGRLKAMGVRLAIDDFGTGYSSLSYLTRFSIDSLKLDRSFVHDIVARPDAAIVVSAVIKMARSLRHTIVAEGVETAQELAFLQAHHCDEGQGYYFSRPVAAPQFAELLVSESMVH